MQYKEYMYTLAEIAYLEGLISRVSAAGGMEIEKMGLEHRLDKARSRIDALTPENNDYFQLHQQYGVDKENKKDD